MKLLFDENISHKVVNKIAHLFPDSIHIKQIQPLLISDSFIFEYARHNDFSIITFDEDFNNLSLLKGYPPKIIWLRTGNTSTEKLAQLIIEKSEVIKGFLSPEFENDYGCLEPY